MIRRGPPVQPGICLPRARQLHDMARAQPVRFGEQLASDPERLPEFVHLPSPKLMHALKFGQGRDSIPLSQPSWFENWFDKRLFGNPETSYSELLRTSDHLSLMNQADQLEQVRAALGTVTDPEIDKPVTTLEFISSLRVNDDNGVSTGRH